MTNSNSNLRKAAVLIRSVDAETAATLLAQLSPAEATSIRQAIRALGPMDPEEQADVLAEFRRIKPMAAAPVQHGVELTLSAPLDDYSRVAAGNLHLTRPAATRFEFLESAPTSALVPYLAREHAQTIAVVLSHLAPGRAASVLAALPAKTQADTIERLSVLGETDAESVTVLERELATWVAKRTASRNAKPQGGDTVTSILAAADAKTRDGILMNLKAHNATLAEDIMPAARERPNQAPPKPTRMTGSLGIRSKPAAAAIAEYAPRRAPQPPAPSPQPQPLPRIEFDHLIHLDARTLATVLGKLDADVLALALAGSRDELVDRICEQMPKRTARSFRRELRRMRPTRLSDVEAAQRAVADMAARELAVSRVQPTAAQR